LLAKEAKQRLKTSTGGKTPRPVAALPQADKGKSRDKAAKVVGASARYISDVKAIKQAAQKGSLFRRPFLAAADHRTRRRQATATLVFYGGKSLLTKWSEGSLNGAARSHDLRRLRGRFAGVRRLKRFPNSLGSRFLVPTSWPRLRDSSGLLALRRFLFEQRQRGDRIAA
jgi:hypothetical protein